LGNQFKSVSEMCRHWGIEVNKFNKRYSAGYSIEQCLTGGEVKSTKKECTDHLGNQFESVAEMCRHWGVSYDLFRSRCSAGYTLEQSLTGEGINRHTSSKKCTDHLGNHFKSVSEMCSHWGVTKYAFITRSKAGYTLEQCLTGKDVNKAAGNKKPCKDHLGNQFESIAARTRHGGITQNDFYNRCRAGYTLEQCLTGKGIK
ncbi:MAG: hypothetical protein U0L26_05705, partial [Cellulosilyticum sp.]|nr:hypothetical protein [Cellulosilyticum sp.]